MSTKIKKAKSIVLNQKNILLTPRQFQCLALLSIGKSSKEIAYLLDVSPRTIETHIEQLKMKLNFYRRSDLTWVGLQNNLEKQAMLILSEVK